MKKVLSILLALCLVLSVAAVAFADAAAKDGGSKIIFTTGGEAGTYFGFGGVLAQKVSEVTSTNVTATASGGSAANIDALDMGDAQLGFSQSDVLSYAYEGVRSFEDLKVGMEMEGTVRNVVDFGAFVDIGVKNDGLVHISEMSKRYIKHPMEVVSVGDTVKVRIIKIDADTQRVGLTMKL